MEGARNSISGGNVTLINALTQPSANSVVVVIIFAMIIAFMFAALLFAKNSGAAGAAFATSFAQSTVKRVITSPVAPIRAGYGMAAREVAGGLGRRGARTYDKFIGDNVHKGGAVGFLAKQFDYVAGDKITGSLTNLSKKQFGGVPSLEEKEKHEKHRDHVVHDAHQQGRKNSALDAALAMPKGTEAKTPEQAREQIRDRDLAITKALSAMTAQERENTKYFKSAADGIKDVVRNLSQADFEALMKNDKIDAHVKDVAKDNRFSDANVERVVSSMTPQAAASLPEGVLTRKNAAGEYATLKAMRGNQIAAIDPDKISTQTLNEIKAFLAANPTSPEVQKFHALIDAASPATKAPGVAKNPGYANKWNGYYP